MSMPRFLFVSMLPVARAAPAQLMCKATPWPGAPVPESTEDYCRHDTVTIGCIPNSDMYNYDSQNGCDPKSAMASIPLGKTVTFVMSNTKSVQSFEWNCGDSNEHTATDRPFAVLTVEHTADGRLHWIPRDCEFCVADMAKFPPACKGVAFNSTQDIVV